MNSAVVRALLVRGMLAGLAAGLLALLVAYFLGEPPLEAAIAHEGALAHYESAHGQLEGANAHQEGAHSHQEGDEVVGRTLQSTAGLATGILVFCVAQGGIAALAFCFALGRIGRFTPRATAALLCAAGLITVFLVPFLKYPASPPPVGEPDTIVERTVLYFLMMLLGVLLAVGTTILGRRLAPRLGNWNATVVAGAGFVVAMGFAYAFLPAVNEVPENFPATLLWEFRLAVAAVQVTMWASFGLVFGHLAERLLQPRTAAASIAARAVPPQTATPAPH